MSLPVDLVVPTLGRSSWLDEVLARLEAGPANGGERLLVRPAAATALERPGWRAVELPGLPGFARAANAGIAAGTAPLVALVNDDAWPEPGWLAQLQEELELDPRLGAVQGVNLTADESPRCDGCGIAWNRSWQAIQVGHGETPPPAVGASTELFGVSATATLYRRTALAQVALAGGAVFDLRFESWYEDVELAIRLRAAGWLSRLVPAARTRHRGSQTGATMPLRRELLVSRNRWWATARLLGRRWPLALPRLLAADLREASAAARRGNPGRAVLRLAGPLAALPALPCYLRTGPALGAGPSAEQVLAAAGAASDSL